MKVKELQIGDLVSYYETSDHEKKIRIESIIEEGVNLSGGEENLDWFDCDKIQPIPLTAEILGLNGISEMVYVDENEAPLFALRKLTKIKGYRLNTYAKQCNITMNIIYVHELQHALRLCGLNELADKLKIQ